MTWHQIKCHHGGINRRFVRRQRFKFTAITPHQSNRGQYQNIAQKVAVGQATTCTIHTHTGDCVRYAPTFAYACKSIGLN